MYMYTYTQTNTHASTHTTHTDTHTHTHTRKRSCVTQAWLNVQWILLHCTYNQVMFHIDVSTHTQTHTPMQTQARTHTHTSARVWHMHGCMFSVHCSTAHTTKACVTYTLVSHTHTHTHAHTHTHTRSCGTHSWLYVQWKLLHTTTHTTKACVTYCSTAELAFHCIKGTTVYCASNWIRCTRILLWLIISSV